MKNKKNTLKSQLKRLFVIILFISIITQINIAITGAIQHQIKENQIKKELMLCPPDCCTIAEDLSEYDLPNLPQLEILNIDVKPIK
jgi:hypothetical protein